MATPSRNVVQLQVFDLVARRAAEHGALAMVARCTQDWQAWERDGYADAFARAWSSGERDADKLASLTIQCAVRKSVNGILDTGRR
jgi:hypothetical protein